MVVIHRPQNHHLATLPMFALRFCNRIVYHRQFSIQLDQVGTKRLIFSPVELPPHHLLIIAPFNANRIDGKSTRLPFYLLKYNSNSFHSYKKCVGHPLTSYAFSRFSLSCVNSIVNFDTIRDMCRFSLLFWFAVILVSHVIPEHSFRLSSPMSWIILGPSPRALIINRIGVPSFLVTLSMHIALTPIIKLNMNNI